MRWRTKFEPVKPAPPQTSSFIAGPPSSSSRSGRGASTGARARRGGGSAGRTTGAAARGAGTRRAPRGWRWGGARALGGGRGVGGGAGPGLLERGLRELLPRALPAAGDVEDAAQALLGDLDERRGEVAGEGGAADLVGDDVDRVAVLGELEHRGDEVLPVRAEDPGGADDRVLPLLGDGVLARQLGAAVGAPGTRGVALGVRLGGGAVEDIVGGHVDEKRRGGGEISGAVAIDAR